MSRKHGFFRPHLGRGFPQVSSTTLREGGGVQPPAALGWPAAYAFSVGWSDSAWTDYARRMVPAPFGVGATAYFVSTTGNNANDGLSLAQAKRDINAAITAGNATGGPFVVYVSAGEYNRQRGLRGTAGTLVPTQPCAIIGSGGVTTGPWDDLTYADDASGTNTYTATLSNVARVLDRLNSNAYGSLNDLTLCADIAAVRTTLGGYVISGGAIYIRRADLAAVTSTNTRVFRPQDALALTSAADFYMEGISVQGGARLLVASGSATRNVALVDCRGDYAGSTISLADGFSVTNQVGLFAAIRCGMKGNAKDGINLHNTDLTATYALAVDCVGIDQGRFTSTSNNALTLHENVTGVDINGDYSASRGGNVSNIDDTKMWCYGTACADDLGDGSITPSDFMAADDAIMWLENCTASGSERAIRADGNSVVYTRNFVGAGTQTAAAGASITAF